MPLSRDPSLIENIRWWAPIVTMVASLCILVLAVGGIIIGIWCAAVGIPLMHNANALTVSSQDTVLRASKLFFEEYSGDERSVIGRNPYSPAHDTRGIIRTVRAMMDDAQVMFTKGGRSINDFNGLMRVIGRVGASAAREIMFALQDVTLDNPLLEPDDDTPPGDVKHAPVVPPGGDSGGDDVPPEPAIQSPFYTPRHMRK